MGDIMVAQSHYITHNIECSGYTYWTIEVAMPRIHDAILNCSIYLYKTREDAHAGEKTGGSGFLTRVPSSFEGGYVYAVTNSHVIREGNSPIIRINTKANDFDIYIAEPRHWYHHPDGDDLAVLPLSLEFTRYNLSLVPIGIFVDSKIIYDNYIGAGDGVFMIGRFIGYDSKQKNEPTVRFGNLSLGTPVGIEHERGYTQESYLIESRSLSGYSGSPVFVYVPPFSQRWQRFKGETKPITTSSVGRQWLLGVDWGHKYMDEYVRERNGEICSEQWKVRTNSGISCVVPAWKLMELLYIEELTEMRRENDEKMKREAKEKRQKKETGTSLDGITKNEFHHILDKASQPIEKPKSGQEQS